MKTYFKIFLYFSLFTISFSLLTSCSPERRLHRLIKKFPQLSKIDTLKIQDTTVIPQIQLDTFFHFKTITDTLTFTKEKLKIQLSQINDTIYLNSEVKADTIIITKEIPVERIIHVKPKSVWERVFGGILNDKNIFIIVLIVILIFIFRLVKK